MGTVPFSFEDSLIEKIANLQINKPDADTEEGKPSSSSPPSWACKILEIYLNLDEEKVYSKDTGEEEILIDEEKKESMSLSFLADCSRSARYFLVKFLDKNVKTENESEIGNPSPLALIYYCPEMSPIREKMMYSTAKATIMNEFSSKNIQIQKLVEVHEEEEMKDMLIGLYTDLVKGSSSTGPNSASSSSDGKDGNSSSKLEEGGKPSSLPPTTAGFSKPTRRGRGGARIIKGGK